MKHRTHTSRALGITLIEMMVSLAITSFVLLVINQLFNQVITTVRRGTQGGEILHRSRAMDEQLAIETELKLGPGDPTADPAIWWGRMVGPLGRDGASAGEPGGFLVIIQRQVAARLTLKDQVELAPTSQIRSDQLMFIYDQTPTFDDSGKHRLPPMAPASDDTYAGEMWNSYNSDYIRMWYGHVVQLPEDPTTYDPANHALGVSNATNPNALAQDWVLGRHALFLINDDIDPVTLAPLVPLGIYGAAPGNITFVNGGGAVPGGATLAEGLTDASSITLNNLTGPGSFLDPSPSALTYQNQVATMVYARDPLLTAARPANATGDLTASEIAPGHTYFMGGVSDFIVEFAGDLITGQSFQPTAAAVTAGPDGELDRDPNGRIKWYTSPFYANPGIAPSGDPGNINAPVTYPAPLPADYKPHAPQITVTGTPSFPRANDAFVWQHEVENPIANPGLDADFTQWPWMIRIRYRLHDRRGDFEGRQVTVNTITGETEPEPGEWFETIIPVNHQGVK